MRAPKAVVTPANETETNPIATMALIAQGPMLDRMKLKSVGILGLESTNENEGCQRSSKEKDYWLNVTLRGIADGVKTYGVRQAHNIKI